MPLRGRLLFDKQGNVYFITTTLFNQERIFSLSNKYPLIVINSLKHLIAEHRASLYAYVIMPTHIHLLIHVPVGESIIGFMRDLKKYTSVQIRKQLESDNKMAIIERLKENYLSYKGQTYKVWMDRFDDLIITTQKIFDIKMEYIHNNPVKAGLVENIEDWKYSSARNYILGDNSIISVRTDLGFED